MRGPRMRHVLCGLLLTPLLALAGGPDDYAQAWAIAPSRADAGAYRVVLDDAVYRGVQRADLADLDVFDANGVAVPAGLVAPRTTRDAEVTPIPLRWFPLPADAAAQHDDLSVISTRSADGRVLRVETRSTASTDPASSTFGKALLVDVSPVREALDAIELQWADDASVDSAYRVERSDDLRTWTLLEARAPVLDLQRDGARLRHARLPLAGAARYLRLTPLAAQGAPDVTGVVAIPAPLARQGTWTWIELDGRAHVEQGRTVFDYTMPGRYPVRRIDIDAGPNSTGRWTLHSRDDAEDAWRSRAGPWVAFRIRGDGREARSPEQALGNVVRDRQWRLQGGTSAATVAPQLRLGYQAESVVFLAQGAAPFVLAAGSGRAMRADAPLTDLLVAMRQQHGADWQVAPANLAATPVRLGDDAALQAVTPRDWTRWLLWAVLLAGVLLVAGFAVRLLRSPPPA